MDPAKDDGAARLPGRSFYGAARGVLGRLEVALIALGAVCIFAFGAYITLGIVLRTFFASQIPDEVVIVGELMVGALILPLAYVAADRGFIAVEVLTAHFGRRVQTWLNVLTAVVGLVAVVPITYAGFLAVVEALESGNYFFGILELPEWPGRLAFFCGYVTFLVRLVDLLIHDLLLGLGVLADPEAETQHDYTWEDPA